jgi:hypothetical protein
MRRRFSLVLLALSVLNSGCTLICDGIRTVCTCVEDVVDDCRECRRDRQLADEVWRNTCGGKGCYSADYVHGFKDGFVDYLYRGGNCEVPPLPPAKYRKFRYQTPDGYQAILDWFEGYRQGATAARETNYRRWITGPAAPGFGPAGCVPGEGHPAVLNPYPVLPGKGPEALPVPPVPATKMGSPVPVERPEANEQDKSTAYPRTGIDFLPIEQ